MKCKEKREEGGKWKLRVEGNSLVSTCVEEEEEEEESWRRRRKKNKEDEEERASSNAIMLDSSSSSEKMTLDRIANHPVPLYELSDQIEEVSSLFKKGLLKLRVVSYEWGTEWLVVLSDRDFQASTTN
jgi:hypothetical protein